jgi:hypothetical protein
VSPVRIAFEPQEQPQKTAAKHCGLAPSLPSYKSPPEVSDDGVAAPYFRTSESAGERRRLRGFVGASAYDCYLLLFGDSV